MKLHSNVEIGEDGKHHIKSIVQRKVNRVRKLFKKEKVNANKEKR